MPQPDAALIERIRAASRKMVRELGFMQPTVAGTQYPPSAVHALLEIEAARSLSAVQLAGILGLEKSSVSRMIRKLIDAGELQETATAQDGRVKLLTLTARGKRTAAAINAFGRRQVAGALEQLGAAGQEAVGRGLAIYADALEAKRAGASADELRAEPGIAGASRPRRGAPNP